MPVIQSEIVRKTLSAKRVNLANAVAGYEEDAERHQENLRVANEGLRAVRQQLAELDEFIESVGGIAEESSKCSR